MHIWLNNELDNLESYFGRVARNSNNRNFDHYSDFHWYNRGKEERKMRNLITQGLEDDVVLYRYIPITQLWQMITTKKLKLVNPSLWKDPLESPLFNAKIRREGKLTESPFKNRYFAQCFTINDTSESMWKTYGNGDSLARIKTTIGELKKIVQHNNNRNAWDFYLGRVVYLNFEDINELFQNGYIRQKAYENIFTEDQAKTLLVKRYAYSYEKEIRLIFDYQNILQGDARKKIPKIIDLDIPDCSSFIHEILLDPDMPPHDVTFYKKAWFAIAPNAVKKCNLYDKKQYQLVLH